VEKPALALHYSFVDLVEEAGTHVEYAMKRIQCPETSDVEQAMKEAEYHRIFHEDTIVRESAALFVRWRSTAAL